MPITDILSLTFKSSKRQSYSSPHKLFTARKTTSIETSSHFTAKSMEGEGEGLNDIKSLFLISIEKHTKKHATIGLQYLTLLQGNREIF